MSDYMDAFGGWLASLGSVQMIFDVGANRGQTVASYRRRFSTATVHSFEPGTEAFLLLSEATTDDPNSHCHQLALGASRVMATLYENSNNMTNSLLQNAPNMFDYAPAEMCRPIGSQQVTTVRLDDFCAEQSIDLIDILKIDTQGFEDRVLSGAGAMLTPSVVRAIQLEVCFVELYESQSCFAELTTTLVDRGYRLFGFTSVKADATHGWKWADALFVDGSHLSN